MAARQMTAKQRTAVEALEAARLAGVSLVEHARANGLIVRELYDAIAALRRRGALPPAAPSQPRRRRAVPERFLPVRVMSSTTLAAAAAAHEAAVCRLVHPGGMVLDCAQWPPVEWLSAMLAGPRDAAS